MHTVTFATVSSKLFTSPHSTFFGGFHLRLWCEELVRRPRIVRAQTVIYLLFWRMLRQKCCLVYGSWTTQFSRKSIELELHSNWNQHESPRVFCSQFCFNYLNFGFWRLRSKRILWPISKRKFRHITFLLLETSKMKPRFFSFSPTSLYDLSNNLQNRVHIEAKKTDLLRCSILLLQIGAQKNLNRQRDIVD